MLWPRISYAQYAEDVWLMRCFSGQPTGFFLEIGAYDPQIDSISAHFYHSGWRGISVEPHPNYFRKFQASRPNQTVLNCAASDTIGGARFTLRGDTGLASIVPESLAEPINQWHDIEQTITVPTRTLADICAEHVPAHQAINFMVVDVEGAEAKVLRGNDWGRYRPELCIIEATRPLSDISTWHEWGPYLTAQGYHLLHHDGLNCYLARADVAGRFAPHFRTPISPIFDNFVPNQLPGQSISVWFRRTAKIFLDAHRPFGPPPRELTEQIQMNLQSLAP